MSSRREISDLLIPWQNRFRTSAPDRMADLPWLSKRNKPLAMLDRRHERRSPDLQTEKARPKPGLSHSFSCKRSD
jgi:hypothetical protein